MPAFNEVMTIEKIVASVLAIELPGVDTELIVVDDGSTDGTTALVQKLASCHGVRVLYQSENRGKGSAVARGIAEASGDVILLQDADLEYDPSDYGRLLSPILSGHADVVFGTRFGADTSKQPPTWRWHALGNYVLTALSNVATGVSVSDMACCYKAFTRAVAVQLDLRARRFEIDAEIVAKIGRLDVRVCEVPVLYKPRTYAEGKKIGLKDVLPVVCHLRAVCALAAATEWIFLVPQLRRSDLNACHGSAVVI